MSGRSPFLAIQKGCYTALNSASITALVSPNEGDSLPYTVIGMGTVQTGWAKSKTSEGYRADMDFASWATTLTEAQSKADTGIQALTNEDSIITVTGYTVIQCKLDRVGPPVKWDMEPNVIYWNVPYTIKYEIRKN